MKYILSFLWVVLFSVMIQLPVQAKEALFMGFIYPGGEGSSEEAQAVLDDFFHVISLYKGPDMKGKYFPDEKEALKKIRSKDIDVGIVSLDFYLKYHSTIPMELLSASLPVASSNAFNRYYLMTNKTQSKNTGPIQIVHLPRSLDSSFIQKVLLNNEEQFQSVTVKVEPNILGVLKGLSESKVSEGVLLGSFEYEALKRMKLGWVKNLKLVYTSPEVPSSPLVAFKKITPEMKKQLLKSLSFVTASDEGSQTLETLRLRGFQDVDKTKYSAVVQLLRP